MARTWQLLILGCAAVLVVVAVVSIKVLVAHDQQHVSHFLKQTRSETTASTVSMVDTPHEIPMDVMNNVSKENHFGALASSMTPRHLNQIATTTAARSYRTALPFPHVVIDNTFPESVLDAISLEVPDIVELSKNGNCSRRADVCIRDNIQTNKGGFNREQNMGLATRAMFAFLRSTTFISFLEQVSGIAPLIPDPQYKGGGVHQTSSNGWLKVHSDANTYSEAAVMYRRVNLFIFLNRDWKDEFGGHMELWDKDLQFCVQCIAPIFNRMVFFSTTDYTWHGHAKPLAAGDRTRRSIALYYYTIYPPPPEDCFFNDCNRTSTNGRTNTTLGKTACDSCWDPQCKRWKHT